MDYKFVKNLLSERKNIVITTHKTPDGDALGSSLALFHALEKDHNARHAMSLNAFSSFQMASDSRIVEIINESI